MSQCARRVGVHVSTLHRWRLHGVRGHRLPTVVIGGMRYVLDEDLDRFLAALNGDDRGPHSDLVQQADAAGKVLDSKGVRSSKEVQ